MDWPCRYGDAECPVLPAEPGSGMRTVSSWNQATGETVLAPSVVDEVPCLQVVRQLIADLRASRAREARYRENYEFQQAAAQRFYTERGELQQRINKALAELDAHDAENDYRRMAHQQRLSPVRLARVRTALTGTDFADG